MKNAVVDSTIENVPVVKENPREFEIETKEDSISKPMHIPHNEIREENDKSSGRFYENYFLQFGTGYLLSRFVLSQSMNTSLVLALSFVILIRLALAYVPRFLLQKKKGALEEFYLDPLGMESYLLTEDRCVNIEFDNESTYFKVIVE